MDHDLYYDLKHLSSDELNQILDELWKELKTNTELRREVLALGLNPEMLDASSRSDLIKIHREASGFDTTSVAIWLAPVAATVLRDIWKKVLLPRIQKNRGKDAIKPAEKNRRVTKKSRAKTQ